jgi:hypothetical protein
VSYMLVYRCRVTFLDIRCRIYLKKDSYAEFYVASLVLVGQHHCKIVVGTVMMKISEIETMTWLLLLVI